MKNAGLDSDSIVIDGAVAAFDGWNDNIAASGVTAFGLSVYGNGVIGTVAKHPTDYIVAVQGIESATRIIESDRGHFVLARSAADIRSAKRDGKTAIYFFFHNGRPLEDDLGRLEYFHNLGVQNMQLTQNDRNFLGDGCLEPSNAGLSNLGRRVVKEMNRLSMLIDLSHSGERTSLEAMHLSDKPCIFSHSDARALVDNPRNITDEQIKLCAETGGVVGACAWGPISWDGGETPPGIESLIGHMEHVASLVGIDHVGVSTDTTIATRSEVMLQRVRAYNEQYPEVVARFVERFGDGPDSLQYRQPVRPFQLPVLTARLLEKGWTQTDVSKAMGGNFLRVFAEVWGA